MLSPHIFIQSALMSEVSGLARFYTTGALDRSVRLERHTFSSIEGGHG